MGGLSVIGLMLSAAAPIVSGVMQRSAAKSAAAQAQEQAAAQARIAEQNRGLALGEAEAASKAGAKEEQKVRDRVRATLGAQNAQYGAAGLSLASGSPLDVGLSTLKEGEADVDAVRENFARKKFSLVNQAQQYGAQGQYALMEGDAKARAYEAQGKAALTGGLLQSAGFVASKWDDRFGASRDGGVIGSANAGDFYSYGSLSGANDSRTLLRSQSWYKDFRPKWGR